MNHTHTFVRGADCGWETMAEGVRRQVLRHGTDLMVVRVEFEAGAVGKIHNHPHRQATYVVEGSFDVTVDGKQSELTTGDCFYVATNLPHGVRALEAGVLLDVFTPVREDFLKPAP